ncbi:MAG: sporulation integral membrane protein YtvI [Clostridiaceae bacterium]
MNFRINYRLKKILIFAAVVVSVLAGVFLSFRLAYFLLPFLIAFALSSLMEPIIRQMGKLHIKRKIAAPVVLLILLAIIVFLLIIILLRLIEEFKSLIISAPGLLSSVYSQFVEWTDKSTKLFEWLPKEITDNLGSIISNLSSAITNLGTTVLKGAYTTAISFPEALVFTVITVMATYFMASDREKISSVFHHHLPESWIKRILSIKKDMFSAVFGYLRAALIIMSITFIELFIGFNIIGVKYPLLLAFLISIIDALPVLGTGGVLIPWALYSFVTNDIRMGVSLIVLYLIVLVIRQIIEPKIVGRQIGVYPLLTLAAMYTGLQLIGFAGLILGPITFLLVRNIFIAIYKGRTFKDIIGYYPEGTSKPGNASKPEHASPSAGTAGDAAGDASIE